MFAVAPIFFPLLVACAAYCSIGSQEGLADLQRADELRDDGHADHEVDEVGSVHGHSDEDEKRVSKEAQAPRPRDSREH